MGLQLDKQRAIERFGQALALARSDTPLPPEWLERTRSVALARSKTFTPVLGNALLAKATDRFVDVFSLREGESHKSFSARSFAKDVFVPCCVRAGIDIRNKGAEPLNNQPFFHSERITPHMNVKPNAVEDLSYLCECLERADFLEDRSALEALAAFLRARIEATATIDRIELGARRLDLKELMAALDRFTAGDSEGGKVGQAVVTAILELVFRDVRTKAINDPSSKWPGDVGVFDDDTQTLSVEVKQRPFTETEILLFALRLKEIGLHRGFIAALDQSSVPLDQEQIRFQANRLHGVELSFFEAPSALLLEACRYAPRDIPLSAALLPRYVAKRLEEIEASASRIGEWASLFTDGEDDSKE